MPSFLRRLIAFTGILSILLPGASQAARFRSPGGVRPGISPSLKGALPSVSSAPKISKPPPAPVAVPKEELEKPFGTPGHTGSKEDSP